MVDMQNATPLGSWMRSLREANGWSYMDVAQQAERHGFKVSKSAVERLEKTSPVMLKKDQVEWLSAVFKVAYPTVVRIFLSSMGYPLHDEQSTLEDAVKADSRLSTSDKSELLMLISHKRKRAKLAPVAKGERSDGGNQDAEKSSETADGGGVTPIRPAGWTPEWETMPDAARRSRHKPKPAKVEDENQDAGSGQGE